MKEIQSSFQPNKPNVSPLIPHNEEHVEVGQFLKSFIYGGLDGTINILTLILSSHAINLHNNVLVAVTFAASFGEAIGMGLGDYVSYKSEQQYVMSERQREEYEMQYMPDEEQSEMLLLLRQLNYSADESNRLIKLYSTNSDTFLSLMMMIELGLVVNHVEAWQIGLVNFSSFFIAGLIPLIPYILTIHSDADMLICAIIIGILQLFTIGYVKATIIGGDAEAKYKSGIELLVFGGAVIIIGSFCGSLFGK